jgi:SPP1 gp7 family putative phage head morphogenesis protein/MYXO-CTERM domain-containing protein
LIPALQRLDRVLLAAYVRQVTEREEQLRREWEIGLALILSDLYWEPLYQLSAAPDDDDEDDLLAWLLLILLAGFARRRLIGNLDAYQRWSADAGGAMALELLGVGGGFHLTNADLLAVIEDRRQQLTESGTSLSLIDTTAAQLERGIRRARQEEEEPRSFLAPLIATWSVARAASISTTEMTWAVAGAQGWTYQRNDVAEQMFSTREDSGVCPICSPLHGVVVPVDDVPLAYAIPQHVGCRCMWEPVTAGWEQPETIWRGE